VNSTLQLHDSTFTQVIFSEKPLSNDRFDLRIQKNRPLSQDYRRTAQTEADEKVIAIYPR
jgi:hypothetical protein